MAACAGLALLGAASGLVIPGRRRPTPATPPAPCPARRTQDRDQEITSAATRATLATPASFRPARPTPDFIDVTTGLDGLIYGLSVGITNQVFVYDPHTTALVRSVPLGSPGEDIRTIAVDATGNILVGTWDGFIQKYDPTGANLLASVQVKNTLGPESLLSLALDRDGQVAAGGREGTVFLTNESLASVTSFTTNKRPPL